MGVEMNLERMLEEQKRGLRWVPGALWTQASACSLSWVLAFCLSCFLSSETGYLHGSQSVVVGFHQLGPN